MNTKKFSIILVLLATFLTSGAQIFLKLGANILSLDIFAILLNPFIVAGLLFYGIAAIVAFFALKYSQVSVVYPVFATSYVWVAFSSSYFFGEELNMPKWIGIGLIVIGVSILGFGDDKK